MSENGHRNRLLAIGLLVAGIAGLFFYRLQPTHGWGFKVGLLDSLTRVFRQRSIGYEFQSAMNLSTARNEYENFQIVFYKVTKGRNDVAVVAHDFVSPSGMRIGKDNVLIRLEKYVRTEKPYYKTEYVGNWPDPLVPFQTVELTPAHEQPLWVTVFVPPGTAPGTYVASIDVMAGQAVVKSFPVTLKVWDFDLPVQGHLKTAFDLYEHLFPQWLPRTMNETQEEWKERLKQTIERYYEDMLRHRLSPIFNFDVLATDFSERMTKYLRLGLNNFAVGRYSGTFGTNWPQDDEKLESLIPLYRNYAGILQENGWSDRAYIYTIDEGKIGDPRVPKICSMIHRANPQLKNMVCYHGFWDPNHDKAWGKDIDIWTFQIEEFHEKKLRRLQDKGIETWTYPSGPGDVRFPNLAIDFPSTAYRIIPWMCWKYNIKGFLYWCVNWWTVDPYASAANTKWKQNGNGLLYYPPLNLSDPSPTGSLRLEILRDGLEDYEYLYLLREKYLELSASPAKAKQGETLRKMKELLELDAKLVQSMGGYTKNSSLLLRRREAIGDILESVHHILGGHHE